MPVPFPDPSEVRLLPPDAAETLLLSRGIVSATAPVGGLTSTQRLLIEAISSAMTGYPATLDAPSIGPEDWAAGLAPRDEMFRARMVQVLVLVALVLRPIPTEVAAKVAAFAKELSIDEGMLEVAQRFASGSLGLAATGFERNGYTAEWHADDVAVLHTSGI